MVTEIIFVILVLLVVGQFKKDFTTLLFSGLGLIFYGLMVLNGVNLAFPYSFQFGILIVCYGAYVCLRSSLDLITFKRRSNGRREE